MGMRESAQRSVGGMAVVVITAMVTIMVNRLGLSAPMDKPMVATITSVEPRAFMPLPSASDFRKSEAAELAAQKRAAEFAEAGDDDQPDGERSKIDGSLRMVRSALKPAVPKNTGMKKAMISPRNCSSM